MEIKTILLNQIYIGDRFRKEYEEIDQLAHSIKKNGLINPISVGVTKNLSSELQEQTSLPFFLFAGGRRLQAISEVLKWDSIPCRVFSQELSSLEYRSIELAENIDRKDMTYVEKVNLLVEIDNLQTAIHGKRVTREQNSGWTQADTAELVGKHPSSVTLDLRLGRAMKEFPELQLDKCKNKAEAMKRLKGVSKTITDNIKAEAFEKKNTRKPDKLFSKLSSSYIVGDCMDTISQLPASTINFVEIDPPYAIDLHNIKRDNECLNYNEIDPEKYESLMTSLFKECHRVMKSNSWLICWFGPDPWFSLILQWLQKAEFEVRGIPGIWNKGSGQTQQPEIYLSNSYEMFFYARKGRPVLQKPGRSNVFNFPAIPPAKKNHPTQRPFALMKELYSTFQGPNSTGFIPFLGSGVGLLAGHFCKINMIGTDLSNNYKNGYIIELEKYIRSGGEENV